MYLPHGYVAGKWYHWDLSLGCAGINPALKFLCKAASAAPLSLSYGSLRLYCICRKYQPSETMEEESEKKKSE